MIRAVIMSFKGSRAIVLAEGGRFMRVPRRPQYEIGDEIELEPEEAAGDRRRAFLPAAAWRKRAFLPAAACCAAVILLAASVWWPHTPPVVAYVTLDVNPSLELGIDGKEKVRSLDALNADAEPIVAGISSFKGKDVEEVTAELAQQLASRHLLHGGTSEVVLASVPMREVSGQWEAEVTDKMKRAIETAGSKPADPGTAKPDDGDSAGASGTGKGEASASPSASAGPGGGNDDQRASGGTQGQAEPDEADGKNGSSAEGEAPATVPVVTTVSVPKEVRDEARKNGLSAGKMAFWLKAENEGHDVELETLKKEPLKKIAAEWGGVREVFDEDGSGNGDGDSTSADKWKQLLQQSLAKQGESEPSASKGENGAKDASKHASAGDKDGKSNGRQPPAKGGSSQQPGNQAQSDAKPQSPRGPSSPSKRDGEGRSPSGKSGASGSADKPSAGGKRTDDKENGQGGQGSRVRSSGWGASGAGQAESREERAEELAKSAASRIAELAKSGDFHAGDGKRGQPNRSKEESSGRDKSGKAAGDKTRSKDR
ncbi:anti-sigma factor domain-containing protein [Cohnella zeiphila]|uniref:Anti-sigma factor domain-containing protein n=1 Tax=Cohnella zeiphila TaxID=2761120 RepID=A0A7X0VUM0_9BACL|nr:anti-sigma factor domain-containing protein [Cohnella zeiphila]MBB6731076.1 anti-sigma factor domain-containing protein [Cohnella zeiphila]